MSEEKEKSILDLQEVTRHDFFVGNDGHPGLFYQLRGKEAAPNRVPDGQFNMINETSSNNGVTKKADSNYIFSAPAITVSVNYAQTVFLQNEPFCASVNIIILKNKWLEEHPEAGLYIVSHLINNNQRYTYSCKISKQRLNDSVLSLPVKVDEFGDPIIDPTHEYSKEGYIPDWDYMDSYIRQIEGEYVRQIEGEYVRQIEGYLQVTGLDDYTLTEEEKDALERDPVWEDFLIGDLFATIPFRGDVQVPTGGLVSSRELNPGNTPRISATNANNGIIGYYQDIESKNYRVFENCISVSFLGTVFYHPYRASFDMKVHCLKLKDRELNPELGQFFVSCLQMILCNNSYSIQTSSTDLLHMSISLPVTASGSPDFAFMETYIRAIEKLAIADVVEFKNKRLELTKKII